MNKRISLLASSVAAAALLFGACGGGNNDEDARRGKIEAASANADGKSKADKAPEGQEPTKVGKQSSSDCGTAFEMNWVESPKDLKDAASKSKNIVEGEILDVKPGKDIVVEAPGEPEGEYRIPTQEVTVKVNKTHKGSVKEGENVTLFQTGSECRQAEGDPKYTKGEKHLLLLTDGPEGKQRIISPEGRFKQSNDGTLEPTGHGPTADEVKGKKVKDIEDKLK